MSSRKDVPQVFLINEENESSMLVDPNQAQPVSDLEDKVQELHSKNLKLERVIRNCEYDLEDKEKELKEYEEIVSNYPKLRREYDLHKRKSTLEGLEKDDKLKELDQAMKDSELKLERANERCRRMNDELEGWKSKVREKDKEITKKKKEQQRKMVDVEKQWNEKLKKVSLRVHELEEKGMKFEEENLKLEKKLREESDAFIILQSRWKTDLKVATDRAETCEEDLTNVETANARLNEHIQKLSEQAEKQSGTGGDVAENSEIREKIRNDIRQFITSAIDTVERVKYGSEKVVEFKDAHSTFLPPSQGLKELMRLLVHNRGLAAVYHCLSQLKIYEDGLTHLCLKLLKFIRTRDLERMRKKHDEEEKNVTRIRRGKLVAYEFNEQPLNGEKKIRTNRMIIQHTCNNQDHKDLEQKMAVDKNDYDKQLEGLHKENLRLRDSVLDYRVNNFELKQQVMKLDKLEPLNDVSIQTDATGVRNTACQTDALAETLEENYRTPMNSLHSVRTTRKVSQLRSLFMRCGSATTDQSPPLSVMTVRSPSPSLMRRHTLQTERMRHDSGDSLATTALLSPLSSYNRGLSSPIPPPLPATSPPPLTPPTPFHMR